MSHRTFPEVSERYGSTWRTVARLTCRKCGVSESIGSSKVGGSLPVEVIARKFTEKGWILGPNDQRDLCPGCALKEKEKPLLKVVDKPTPEKPREMGRDDRRIIFEKLNEVYLDEKTGYASGWSDHKVASDLACPRKWVEVVREEMFGSIGTNAEMSEFLSEAEALLAESRKALTDARAAREAVEKILANPSFLTLGAISDRLGKVERLAGEVRKLVVTQ